MQVMGERVWVNAHGRRRLLPIFKMMLTGAEPHGGTIGLMMDFASLPQKNDKGEWSTPEEENRFKLGVSVILCCASDRVSFASVA